MKEICTLCSQHCHKNQLQCTKGVDYFQQSSVIAQNDLTGKLMKCGHILMHKTGKKRGQENILEILSQHDQISQKQLQEMLAIEAGSLSEILSKLEQRNLIQRSKDQNDKRKSIIALTQMGYDKIKNKKSNDEDLFDMLTIQEKQQLDLMLDKILEEWHKRHMNMHKKA